jgi:hypothetical protein
MHKIAIIIMKVSSTVIATFFYIVQQANGLQNLFSQFTAGGTSKPNPLCDRVDLGTLSVSPMGLGTLNLPLDKEVDNETMSVMQVAKDCNINLFDTAEAVSPLFENRQKK